MFGSFHQIAISCRHENVLTSLPSLSLQELQVELDNTLRICQEEIEFEKNEGTEILEIILSTKERTQAMLKRVTDVSIQSTQVFHELLLSP